MGAVEKFKRVIDPEIRRYERLYRISVAANSPDLAALGELDVLQRWRKNVVGKKLRGYSKQYAIL